jgi:hypothetical protein
MRGSGSVHAGRPNPASACDASVNAAEPVTPAMDEEQAPGGTRSEAVPLLHS